MWSKKMSKKGWALPIMVGSVMMLQGCLQNNEDGYDGYTHLVEDIETIETYLQDNGIDTEYDDASGVYYKIHKHGAGYKTIAGAEVVAHFSGTTLENEDFANTFNGSPVEFVLGDAETYTATMTNGVSIGLSYMQEGDSATIYLPSPYGFQDKEYQNVPANSILVYNIKFIEIKKLAAENVKIDQYISDHGFSAEIDPEYGTRYAIHREGNGVAPQNGATVTLHYQGELLDGTVFDSSFDSNFPLSFTMGNRDLIPGFELGVSNLHKNDSATIFVPSIYGYGAQAAGDIPANSVLVFGVDIIDVINP